MSRHACPYACNPWIHSPCLFALTLTAIVSMVAAGAPLRPALLWMDMRSAPEAAACVATGDSALRVNSAGHGPVSAEWFIPKCLWLKRHEPDVWARAAIVCEYQDFLSVCFLPQSGMAVCMLTPLLAGFYLHPEPAQPHLHPNSGLTAPPCAGTCA
jgi:hypothetical protein